LVKLRRAKNGANLWGQPVDYLLAHSF